jgi:hypothetical protein
VDFGCGRGSCIPIGSKRNAKSSITPEQDNGLLSGSVRVGSQMCPYSVSGPEFLFPFRAVGLLPCQFLRKWLPKRRIDVRGCFCVSMIRLLDGGISRRLLHTKRETAEGAGLNWRKPRLLMWLGEYGFCSDDGSYSREKSG